MSLSKMDLSVLTVVIVILALSTLTILATGIFLMATGGKANAKYNNKLMTLRVVAQGATIISLILLYILY
jgi:hypothetical protein